MDSGDPPYIDRDAERRAALARYHVLNTEHEPAFDRLTELAADLLGASSAVIALVDGDRQWCKSALGAPRGSAERERSFRDLAFAQPGRAPLAIPDTLADPRTRDHPMVTGPAQLRFVVCAPLCTASGVKLGLLTVGDREPKPHPGERALKQLEVLAQLVVDALEARAVDFARRDALDQLELLQEAVSHTNDAIFVYSQTAAGADLPRVIHINEAFTRLFGYGAEEVVGRSPEHLISPANDPLVFADMRNRLNAGEAVRHRLLGRHKDGRDIWLDASNAPIKVLPGGSMYVVSVIRDITEALREAREAAEHGRLMDLAESTAGVGHLRIDLVTGERMLSDQMYRLHGVEPNAFTPNHEKLMSFVHPDDRAMTEAQLKKAPVPDEVIKFTSRIIRADGQQRTFDCRLLYEFNAEGEPIALFGINHDVTERAEMQAQLEEAKEIAESGARAKTEFLANMSHELRTPLTSVIGFAGLLRDRPGLDELAARYVSRIDDASRSLLGVVNDVLDYSKLEAGGVELEARPFDPAELVGAAADMLEGAARAKGVRLAVELADGLPAYLRGDAGRLRQVLLNLIGNGVKFTHDGAVTIRAEYGPDETGSPCLTISVRDTGIGIAPEMMDRLFERFVQADGSISRRFGGTGLGLSISRKLAELMGGSISVDSRLGEGSVFVLRAPIPRASGPAADAEPAAKVDRSIRVLLADDAEPNRELVCAILGAVGIEVDAVTNGAEAVEALRRADYDMVLMDVQMPVMDGVQATRRIREMGGRWAGLPIVALSANVLPEQTASYRQAGMDDHLGKPIDARALVAGVVRWAEHRRSATAKARLIA